MRKELEATRALGWCGNVCSIRMKKDTIHFTLRTDILDWQLVLPTGAALSSHDSIVEDIVAVV